MLRRDGILRMLITRVARDVLNDIDRSAESAAEYRFRRLVCRANYCGSAFDKRPANRVHRGRFVRSSRYDVRYGTREAQYEACLTAFAVVNMSNVNIRHQTKRSDDRVDDGSDRYVFADGYSSRQ